MSELRLAGFLLEERLEVLFLAQSERLAVGPRRAVGIDAVGDASMARSHRAKVPLYIRANAELIAVFQLDGTRVGGAGADRLRREEG